MAYTLKKEPKDIINNETFVNDKGNHECVVFTQMAASAPGTATWKRGIKVMEASKGDIPFGAVIATFDENGKYPSTERHAAVYRSHDTTGINVYDQWNAKGKVTERFIKSKKKPKRDKDDADWFWVVD